MHTSPEDAFQHITASVCSAMYQKGRQPSI